jgi:hypothetical protein
MAQARGGTVADNRKKPAAKKPAARRRGGRSNGALWTWLAVGVVVAIVLTIVLVKTTSSSSPPGSNDRTLTSEQIYNQVTKIPASVYDAVGVNSPVITVTPPSKIPGDPKPLTYMVDGKELPGTFYVGAEYCPFCAATRWAIIAALSRFGTYNKLYDMESASNDIGPNTPTFSFYGTTYSSQYLVFKSWEVYTRDGHPLETVPTAEQAIFKKYQPGGQIPFMNIGNKFVVLGSAFDPRDLSGLTREDIAGGLTNPHNPVTQAIITAANYFTASICATTKSAPASICNSAGVQAAATAMHLHL